MADQDDADQRRTRAEIASLEAILSTYENRYYNAQQGSAEERAAKDNLDGLKNQIANKKKFLKF